MEKKVIIVGSSRSNGNTVRISKQYAAQHNAEFIDLNSYEFSFYDYKNKNQKDDFLPLIKKIITEYDTLIFSTPVYWYSMSGIMKTFFDRISDVLTIEKEWGRKFEGKKMGVISNTHQDELPYDFAMPFRNTAEYLKMEYIGHQHYNCNHKTIDKTKEIKC